VPLRTHAAEVAQSPFAGWQRIARLLSRTPGSVRAAACSGPARRLQVLDVPHAFCAGGRVPVHDAAAAAGRAARGRARRRHGRRGRHPGPGRRRVGQPRPGPRLLAPRGAHAPARVRGGPGRRPARRRRAPRLGPAGHAAGAPARLRAPLIRAPCSSRGSGVQRVRLQRCCMHALCRSQQPSFP